MFYFAAISLGSQLILTASGGPPTLNVEPSCRAAAAVAVMSGRNMESCMNDENGAREQLEKSWGDFTAPDKSHCLSLVRTGGGASYVELLTCLENSRDARVLAQQRGKEETAYASTPDNGSATKAKRKKGKRKKRQ